MATKYGFIYIESNVTGREKTITLDNNSEYYGVQSGSPSLVTITGRCNVYPEWQIIQDGAVIGKAKFSLYLADNQRLIVSSYPEDQYARVYNTDGTFSDVSQLADFSVNNYLRVPEGTSTLLAYLDENAQLDVTFKEERLIV